MESRKSKITKLQKETDKLIDTEITLENAKDWLQSGVDYEFRRIDINADVDENMTMFVRRTLTKMVDMSDTIPIEVHLSTWGGELLECLAIYDMFQSCPCQIVMVANGKIMSAGLPIFLAGDVRLSHPSTRFMMHSLSHRTAGKLKDTEIDVKEGRFLNNKIVEILVKHTKKNKKWWETKIASHDYYFGVEDAKELGVIVQPKLAKAKA